MNRRIGDGSGYRVLKSSWNARSGGFQWDVLCFGRLPIFALALTTSPKRL